MEFGPPILGDDEPGEEPHSVIVVDVVDGKVTNLSEKIRGRNGRLTVVDGTGKEVMSITIPSKRMPALDEIIVYCCTLDQVMNDVARVYVNATPEAFVEAARRAAGLLVK